MTVIPDETQVHLPILMPGIIDDPLNAVEIEASIHKGVPEDWIGRLAYVISQIGSPPVLAFASMALAAMSFAPFPGPQAWIWIGGYALLAILFPLMYLIYLLRKGLVSDLDVQLREQRIKPMLFTVACGGLACSALRIGRAPRQMSTLAVGLWVQTAALFVITLRWKISVHCAAATAAAAVVWMLKGTSIPLLVGVPLIAWSRLRLKRHTLMQTVFGTLLGFVVFLPVFLLIG
ncbi:MAG TPA: hypothetical protein ENN19_14300 [Chloroflexi bacterium]|nr:hypothetical protein [Chloroflexota bacterium]